jgi:hypothetical protein
MLTGIFIRLSQDALLTKIINATKLNLHQANAEADSYRVCCLHVNNEKIHLLRLINSLRTSSQDNLIWEPRRKKEMLKLSFHLRLPPLANPFALFAYIQYTTQVSQRLYF